MFRHLSHYQTLTLLVLLSGQPESASDLQQKPEVSHLVRFL